MLTIFLDLPSTENSKQEENNFLTQWVIEDCQRMWENTKKVSTTYYIYEVAHRLRIVHSYFDYYEQDEIHAWLLSKNSEKCLLARKQKSWYN